MVACISTSHIVLLDILIWLAGVMIGLSIRGKR